MEPETVRSALDLKNKSTGKEASFPIAVAWQLWLIFTLLRHFDSKSKTFDAFTDYKLFGYSYIHFVFN